MTMFAAIWTAISLSLLATGAASAAGCGTVAFEGTSFSVCEAAPGDDIRLYLRDDAGDVLGTFDRLSAEAARKGREIVFAMNGGACITPIADPSGFMWKMVSKRPVW